MILTYIAGQLHANHTLPVAFNSSNKQERTFQCVHAYTHIRTLDWCKRHNWRVELELVWLCFRRQWLQQFMYLCLCVRVSSALSLCLCIGMHCSKIRWIVSFLVVHSFHSFRSASRSTTHIRVRLYQIKKNKKKRFQTLLYALGETTKYIQSIKKNQPHAA